VVVGTDERVPITDTEQWGFVAWLGLYDEFGSYFGGCTGTFIGPDTLLTAAHCLWDLGMGWTGDIVVVPGKNGDHDPFGYQFAFDWWVPDQWIETGGDPLYDWGVIKMPDSSMGNTVGWLTVASLTTETLSRPDFTPDIVGYPGDQPFGTMWGAFADQFVRVDPFILLTDIDAMAGQSGSAIFSANPDEWFFGYVVGILIRESIADDVNYGTRIDAELLNDIKHGCQVMGCSISTLEETQIPTPPPPPPPPPPPSPTPPLPPTPTPTPPSPPIPGARFSDIAGDTGGGYWLPFAGDFDGDGDADYGVHGADGRWYVIWNDGNGQMGDAWFVSGPSARFFEISGDTGGGYWLPFAGEFDGDGDADYGVQGADGRWYVIWNRGGAMGDASYVNN
jgi:V8-like Glu-specific endopeptidase